MEVSKLHQLKKKNKKYKKILECIFYIEIKNPLKIVRKIDIKNVASVFLINKLLINKN